MSRLIYTPEVIAKLNESISYYQDSSSTFQKLADTLDKSFKLLESNPKMHKPFQKKPMFHHGVILFGSSGYEFLYVNHVKKDEIVVVAFKHQRESDSVWEDTIQKLQEDFFNL